MNARIQTIVGIVFSAVVLLGLLAADGLFSKTWILKHPITGGTSQFSAIGPPTRMDSVWAVAEPLYADARVPVFFDEAEVRAWFLGLPDDLAARARIGVESGQGSGDVRLFDTAWDGRVLTATVPLAGVPTPGNRLRIVLSLPGMSRPMQLGEFTVTASRRSLVEAVRHRLGL